MSHEATASAISSTFGPGEQLRGEWMLLRSTYCYYRSLKVPRMQKTKSLKLHFWGPIVGKFRCHPTKHISIFFPELWKWKWPKNPKNHICCTRGKTCKLLTNLLKRKLIFNDCFNTLKGSWIDHWTLITKDTSDQFIQIHFLFVPQIFKSVISSWDEHKTMIPTFTLVW